MKPSRPLLRSSAVLVLFATVSLVSSLPGAAGIILQTPNSSFVAFEAEENVTLISGSPTSWVITNDVTPSGSRALYASGANGTPFPSSFATYTIKFTTHGTYKVFFRWRANQQFTDADPNAGNSFYSPLLLNASTTAVNPNPDYSISTVNNQRVRPESNTYHVDGENTALINVTPNKLRTRGDDANKR